MFVVCVCFLLPLNLPIIINSSLKAKTIWCCCFFYNHKKVIKKIVGNVLIYSNSVSASNNILTKSLGRYLNRICNFSLFDFKLYRENKKEVF